MTAQDTSTMGAAWLIGWFYVTTNSARILTYLPQIHAVWRCQDGARALSLWTWGSWVVSHLAALLYGAIVINDTFFVVVSSINLACCLAVTTIASKRRLQLLSLRKARS